MGESSVNKSLMFGVIMIVITLIGWTVTPLFIEHFTGSTDAAVAIDAWTSNGWRYGFAALCWMPLLIVLKARGKWPPGLWKAAMIPALINAGAQVAFTTSFYEIDPALVSFGLRSQMVFTAVGAFLLFPSERAMIRSPVFLVGLAFVIGGTAWTLLGEAMAQVGGADGLAEKVSVLGAVLALTAGAGFACYVIAVRKCMNHLGSIVSFAAISQITAAVQIVLMLIFGARLGAGALDLAPTQFMWLLISAVIGIALGHVFYYVSIKRLGITVSTGVIQLQPFTVAGLSFVWFGERLSAGQWVSGSVAVVGAVLMLVAQQRVMKKFRTAKEVERAMEEETDPRG
ncbi:MAG: drug/metabolite transporter (DMT)-like permease [Phycisphaerales bacterium]